jgi:hypothetical protein
MCYRQVYYFASIVLLLPPGTQLHAFDEFGDIKTISRLPETQGEIERLFARTGSDACEILPKGEPVEITGFISSLTTRDRLSSKERSLPSGRRSLFSVGLQFESSDRASLPALSGAQIASYIDEKFVAIQCRVRKDYLDRKLYYHHRPLALTTHYTGSKITDAFEPVVSHTVRDFHGIGLYVKDTGVLKAEKLRTMVMIFKNRMLRGGSTRPIEQFEFAFVRGRDGKTPDALQQHVFVTSNNRAQLNYLRPYAFPRSQNSVGILGRIAITKFDDTTGLYPVICATRSFKLNASKAIPIETVNAFCAREKLTGGLGNNLDTILDAVIDGKLVAAVTTPRE